MFAWASETFEKLSQHVAPPATDPISRYIHACQRSDQEGAMIALQELGAQDLAHYQVIPGKGQTALHVACLYAQIGIVQHILQYYSHALTVVDQGGNTPLHCAAQSKGGGGGGASAATAPLELVKLLVTQFQADVTVKNASGQTPYDTATINAVRQYLLPLQLQRETQAALDNGGVGLIPGMDLGGLKINSYHVPPPPGPGMSTGPVSGPPLLGGGGPPPPPPTTVPTTTSFSAPPLAPPPVGVRTQSAPPTDGLAPPPTQTTPAPTSGGINREYSRTGYSSAAIEIKGRRALQPDGFHSSSSDKELQKKYGHQPTNWAAQNLPPPPKSGSQLTPPTSTGAAVTAAGLYSAGPTLATGNPYASRLPTSRYVPIDPVTGQAMTTPPVSGGYPYPPTVTPPNITSMYPTPPTIHGNAATTPYQQPVNSNATSWGTAVNMPPTGQPMTGTPTSSGGDGGDGATISSNNSGIAKPYFPPPPNMMSGGPPGSQMSSSIPTVSTLASPSSGNAMYGFASKNTNTPTMSTTAMEMFQTPTATSTTTANTTTMHSPPVGKQNTSTQYTSPNTASGNSPFLRQPMERTKSAELAASVFSNHTAMKISQGASGGGGVTTATASSFFEVSRVTPVTTGTGSVLSSGGTAITTTTALELFGTAPSGGPSPSSQFVHAGNHIQVETALSSTAYSGNDDDRRGTDSPSKLGEDGEFEEVQLSPEPQRMAPPPSSSTEFQSATTTNVTENSNLLAAIGMPPPPFQKK